MTITKEQIIELYNSIQLYHCDVNELMAQNGEPIITYDGDSVTYIWRYAPTEEKNEGGEMLWRLLKENEEYDKHIDIELEGSRTGVNSVLMHKFLKGDAD